MSSFEPQFRPGPVSPEERRTLAVLSRLDELERMIEDQGGATRCDTSLLREIVGELFEDDSSGEGDEGDEGEQCDEGAEDLLRRARTRIAGLHVTLGVDDQVVAHLRPVLHRAVTQVFYLGSDTDTATE